MDNPIIEIDDKSREVIIIRYGKEVLDVEIYSQDMNNSD